MESNSEYFSLSDNVVSKLQSLPGPIFVLGAGGFIGVNLLNALLLYRNDVYGVSQDHKNNWRFIATKTPQTNLLSCDITDLSLIHI